MQTVPRAEYLCVCGHYEEEHTSDDSHEEGCAGCDAGGRPMEDILHTYKSDAANPADEDIERWYTVEWSNVYCATDYRDALRQALTDLDDAINRKIGATYLFVGKYGSDNRHRVDFESDDPRLDEVE